MPTFIRPVAAVLVVALAAISLAVLVPRGPQAQPGGAPSPSPTPMASSPGPTSSTTVRTPSPLEGRASSFPHPFRYTLPNGAGIVVTPGQPTWLYQFRVPLPGSGTEFGDGLAVRVIAGGRRDPCAMVSSPLPLPGGPGAVVDYLKTIPELGVTGEVETTVDGRPAVMAVITPLEPTPDCRDLWLWAEDGSITQNASWDQSAQLTVVDVDGDHIVMLTFGDEAWLPTAQAVIDSISFE